MRSSPALLLAFAFCTTAFTACGPLPIPIPGGKDGGADGGFHVEPKLEDIQKQILTPGCAVASCHAGTIPQSGLDLTDGHSHENLVNQMSVYASTNDGGLILVVPGHPEQSFLMDKLTKQDGELAPQGRGRHMPDRNPYLNEEALGAIRQWITDGAQDN